MLELIAGFGKMAKGEVLPVPPEMVNLVWKSVCRVVLSKIPNYDIERTHTRLLVGIDRLWMAYSAPACGNRVEGVVITSISSRPPKRQVFWRSNPALMKSLTIHIAGEHQLLHWLDSAVERINRYAREQGCRQLFILVRKTWLRYVTRRWYSPEWEMVAVSRDRPTYSKCKAYQTRNTPGYFRPMVPVPRDEFSRHRYRIIGTFYFPLDMEAAQHESATASPA